MVKKVKDKSPAENPEVLAEKLEIAESWIEKNPKTAISILTALVLIAGGYFGFQYYVDTQESAAQQEMFQAIYYFEEDSLNLALEGDGNNLGFQQIISDYKLTGAANLANYYAGNSALQESEFESAISYFNDFSSNDILIQARAYSLTGDAYMELKDYKNAASYYKKAASYKPNKFFTPIYLMKEALAYEKLGSNDRAKEVYQQVIDEYWESNEYSNARKFQARIDSGS